MSLLATLLLLSTLTSPTAEATPAPDARLTLEYRLAPESGFEQAWRQLGPMGRIAVGQPYDLRAVLDGDPWWGTADGSSPQLLHWQGAVSTATPEGAVTARLVVPFAQQLQLGVAALLGVPGDPTTASTFHTLRALDVDMPRPEARLPKQSAGVGGGVVTGTDRPKVGGKPGPGGTGNNCALSAVLAKLVSTGNFDAACTGFIQELVTVVGLVTCPGGLDKLIVQDNFGLSHDYDSFVPPKPPIPTCTTDPFGVRIDVAEVCIAGLDYEPGDIWELEIRCCDGCVRFVTLYVS
jgi:hypothetical protein